MISTKQNIESLTGLLAVGSLGVLGLFLIVDGQTNIFQIFEQYGKSISWGIFAAVPMLVITYMFGLYFVQISEILSSKIKPLNSIKSEQQFIDILKLDNEYITGRYEELKRQKSFLKSSSIAYILLSLGALSEVKQMQHWEFIAYGSSIAALIAAIVSPLIAERLSNKIDNLISACNDIKSSK